MMTYVGKVRIPVQFDVGIGDAITPSPRMVSFPALLDAESPRLKIYPRETVVAEKFETIVKRGLANSRMKDYYDLWVLQQEKKVNSEVAKMAIARTFARRGTPFPKEVPEGLLDSFGTDASKTKQWAAFLRKNRLDVGDATLLDVVRMVRDFVLPLLM